MEKSASKTAKAAMLAALYVVISQAQNLLLPGTGSNLIQFRLSEALLVLAFFTPAAVPGLSLGCLLFNLTSGSGLPLDGLVGTVATLLSAWVFWRMKRPWLLALPALLNGLLVGWQLQAFTGVAFWTAFGCVALGEGAVLLVLGLPLYFAIKGRRLHKYLFSYEDTGLPR